MPKNSTKPRASVEDDIDAITPCPISQQDTPSEVEPLGLNSSAIQDLRSSRSTSPSSECESVGSSRSSVFNKRRDSVKVLEEGTNGDPERLWKRMLALQQIYGCYNSARMAAALESGDVSLLLPSKACLDLLNEDMAMLPNEAEQALGGDWRPSLKDEAGLSQKAH